MKHAILFCLVLIFHVYTCAAQSKELFRFNTNPEEAARREAAMTPAERLNYKLFTHLRFARQFTDSCNAIFTTVVIPIRNKMLVDSLIYEEKCPETIKDGFVEVLSILRAQQWDSIIPAAKDKRDFDVVLPFNYSFKIAGCWDTIPTRTIDWKTEQAMDKRKTNQITSYCLPLLKISRFR